MSTGKLPGLSPAAVGMVPANPIPLPRVPIAGTMATLLSHARQSGCWDFFSQPNLLALLSCLQDSTNEVSLRRDHKDACLGLRLAQLGSPPFFPFYHVPLFSMSSLSWQIRDLASELLVRYFPATFPKPIALALFQLAQDTLGSPRVQEAEAGAVLMKTILQKYELLPPPPSPCGGTGPSKSVLAALVPHQSVVMDGVCNNLAVGNWGGLRDRSLHQGRKELHSTKWAGISLLLTPGSACCLRSDSGTMKSLSLEAEAALTLPSRGLCFAQHLLHVLQAQYKVACQDLLRAAATAPMHGTAPAGQGRAGSCSWTSCLGTGAGQNHGRTLATQLIAGATSLPWFP